MCSHWENNNNCYHTLPQAIFPIFSDDNCRAKLCNSMSVIMEAGAENSVFLKGPNFTDILNSGTEE